jgi:hypothetical protein
MRKRMKLQDTPLAGALLWAFLAMSACVLPQDDNPIPQLPTVFRNHRPQILTDQSSPDQFGKVYTTLSCQPSQVGFSIVVEDLDVGDQIRAAWRGSTIDGVQRTPWQLAPLQNLGSTQARRPEPLVPPMGFFGLPPLNSNGDRRIDVVVTDTHFTPVTISGLEVLTEDDILHPIDDGGIFHEAAGVDSYTWTVTVQSTCP